MVIVVVVLVWTWPLKSTPQPVPEGRPDSVKVTVQVVHGVPGLKLAVMVPVPLIVAIVEAEVELAKVIEPVADQEEKMVAAFPNAVTTIFEASLKKLDPDGLVDPEPDGFTPKVTWSCLAKTNSCAVCPGTDMNPLAGDGENWTPDPPGIVAALQE